MEILRKLRERTKDKKTTKKIKEQKKRKNKRKRRTTTKKREHEQNERKADFSPSALPPKRQRGERSTCILTGIPNESLYLFLNQRQGKKRRRKKKKTWESVTDDFKSFVSSKASR